MVENPHKIRTVVFDLDDTLYPEREYVRSGYRAVEAFLRARRGVELPLADWLWGRFCSGRTSGAFDAMNEHFRLGLTREDLLDLVDEYRGHAPSIQPYPDVPGLLDQLGARYRLGLLSDGYLPAQRLKLEALGLGSRFEAIVFTEEIGRDAWKPSPTGFERIREMLDVPHDACAYVSDNPAKDFLAPNALGWLTVQFHRPQQVHAHKPPPPGGAPKAAVETAEQLMRELARRDAAEI